MFSSLPKLLNDFTDVIFPRECVACKILLNSGENHLCTECLYKLPKTNTWKEKDNYVARLFWGRVYFENAASFLIFQKGGMVQEVIHQFKYKNQKEIGHFLGTSFASELKNTDFEHVDALIPIPLHPKKEKERGYNQSEWFAKGIAQVLNKPILNNTITRIKTNVSQTHKSKYERWMNVEKIFELQRPETIQEKHILLIDDVLTTGATLESCAEELLAVPGVKLSVLTLAVAL